EWRRRRTETKFFESVGRLWKPSDAPRPLTSVGGRAAVVAGIDVVLRGPTRASALLVGEHGVGKTAVLREVLAQLHREGWLIFEAGASELMAGQTYIGQLEGRLREIADRAAG